MTLPSFSALTRVFVLLLITQPLTVSAHQGHILDLVSAFMAPLAGWDHLLMVLVFLLVVVMALRIGLKAVRRGRHACREDLS